VYPGSSVALALLVLRVFAVAASVEALRSICPCGPVRDILLGIAGTSLLAGLSTRGLAALSAAVFGVAAFVQGGSPGGHLAVEALPLVALALGGGGPFSLDALLRQRRDATAYPAATKPDRAPSQSRR
jgi:hypothetical protein